MTIVARNGIKITEHETARAERLGIDPRLAPGVKIAQKFASHGQPPARWESCSMRGYWISSKVA